MEFRAFFDKKAKIDEMLINISHDRNELEKELIHLIQKSKAFSLAANSKNIGSQMTELKKTFAQIDKKKGKFEKELKGLVSLFKK